MFIILIIYRNLYPQENLFIVEDETQSSQLQEQEKINYSRCNYTLLIIWKE